MMTFLEMINQDKPVLVDFFATWCGPCKMMTPILQELKHKIGDSGSIIKIDIDINPQAATVYQVRSVPTLILFKKGEIVWRHTGVPSMHQLEQIIQTNF